VSSTQKTAVNYRYIFKDIVSGFSEVDYDGQIFFVKHLSALDQVDLEVLEEKFYDKAKKRGLPTEEDMLERLDEEEMWLGKDEAEITKQQKYIAQLENTRKQFYLKSDMEANLVQMKEARLKLMELEAAKEGLLGQTCEKYSKNRVSDHYILKSFYKNSELTQEAFSVEHIDDLSNNELKMIIFTYNTRLSMFTDDNIQSMALQDFYSPCYPFSDNVMNFFNKPLFQLSTNQVKLIIFTRMFKNIFENYPKIPDSIRKEPSKIIDYVNAQDRSKDVVDNLEKEGASTVMGATQEDYEYLGHKKTPSGASLTDKLKEKGGRMDMRDLIETMS
jgi:hypothetical protein